MKVDQLSAKNDLPQQYVPYNNRAASFIGDLLLEETITAE